MVEEFHCEDGKEYRYPPPEIMPSGKYKMTEMKSAPKPDSPSRPINRQSYSQEQQRSRQQGQSKRNGPGLPDRAGLADSINDI
jgi:hypothetical protein